MDLLWSRVFGDPGVLLAARFLLDLDVEHLERGGHFREAKYMRDWSYSLLQFRGQCRPGR